MDKVKDVIVYIFYITIAITIYGIIGKYHPNLPILGTTAAMLEKPDYYTSEHFGDASIKDMKECMSHMNELNKNLEGKNDLESIELIDKEIRFFKEKGASVAVLRLIELRNLILGIN